MSERAFYRDIFIKTLPVLMGYIPLGMAFGLLYSQLEMPWYFGLFMSMVVFAGAGQFLLVALLAAQAGYTEIAVATFLLNLRHLFYGISIMEDLRPFGWRKHYIIFGLTDETFALLKSTKLDPKWREKGFFLMAILNHSYWCLGGLLGIWLGESSGFSWHGVEFSLTALFAVLTLDLLLHAPSKKPFYLALFVGVVGLLFFPAKHMLVLSILLTLALLLLARPYLERS